MKGILVLAAVIVSALVLASSAFANSLNCAHGGTCHPGDLGGNIPSSSGGSNPGDATLPFTGIDLAGAAGLGGLLLISGITLHRLGRRRS